MINTEGLSTYDYCHRRLFLYCRLNGYSKTNTYPVYRAILNQILKQFPEPERVGLIAIQEFASTKVLNSIKNTKQKAILALIIDCGLRVSEPCGILISDCNSKERKIILRSAKGNNDGVVYPSQYVWDLIAVYWKQWGKKLSDKYLFDGQIKRNPYTKRSISAFLETHCKECGVKFLGTHAIRRFTGTWWVENNVPLAVAADKMRHSSSRTLEKHYLIHSPTYLKEIKSPLSQIQL